MRAYPVSLLRISKIVSSTSDYLVQKNSFKAIASKAVAPDRFTKILQRVFLPKVNVFIS